MVINLARNSIFFELGMFAIYHSIFVVYILVAFHNQTICRNEKKKDTVFMIGFFFFAR